MNIKEAKDQIKNAMTAYFTKDSAGDYVVAVEKQRPVFLMGPPGIGKTAVMEQIASELGVGLLSYSMTHHTRQSVLGLPFISRKTYGGKEYDVSEYTMSEIIAAVYDMIEETGVKEGILFLDEVNCVSETLSPIMLQFLQYKSLGRHSVPEGWLVVTAGNPPEYNNSVREFDIATWDRLKRIDVEPDFNAWKEYAYKKGVHPAVITYLEIKKFDFYNVQTTVDGKKFVTARAWDDLSEMIKLYELNGIEADSKLIDQYLQEPRIAKDFAVYYDLYKKYNSDYKIDEILKGKVSDSISARAKKAKFDERISLLGMLLDAVRSETGKSMNMTRMTADLTAQLKTVKQELLKLSANPKKALDLVTNAEEKKLKNGKQSGSLSKEEQKRIKEYISIFEELKRLTNAARDGEEAFSIIKADYDRRVQDLKNTVKSTKSKLDNMIKFLADVYGQSQEMVIAVTELTIHPDTAEFLNKYGSDEYFKYNKSLLIYDRQKQIQDEIKLFEL